MPPIITVGGGHMDSLRAYIQENRHEFIDLQWDTLRKNPAAATTYGRLLFRLSIHLPLARLYRYRLREVSRCLGDEL
jgi:hypothetical protein